MYGYLRLINGVTPPSIYRYYREHYCSLCHALWNYYGLRPRFILSYDMTFLSIVLDLDNQVDLDKRLLCYQKAHMDSDQESWKRIAAMSILLATKKLEDDIADENDTKAKIGLRVFHKAAMKAESDYPKVAMAFQSGFSDMSNMEKESKDVYALASKFSEIMTTAVSMMYSCSEADIAVMKHVTQWVYFIDALDDLDKDSLDGSFNPFKAFAETRVDLIDKHADYLESFISEQMNAIKPALPNYCEGTSRNWIIMSTLLDTLPIVTERVMTGEKPFTKNKFIARALQAKGGYKLA